MIGDGSGLSSRRCDGFALGGTFHALPPTMVEEPVGASPNTPIKRPREMEETITLRLGTCNVCGEPCWRRSDTCLSCRVDIAGDLL